MIDILFFGRLGDVSERLHIEIPQGLTDTDGLSSWLSEQNVALGIELGKVGNRIALNKTIITASSPLNDGDEIAYMSPLSGG
ncbi:MAG: MoaD/ThiS family protein [Hellea sp.]